MIRMSMLVIFLVAALSIETVPARADHCLGDYHRAVESIQSLQAKYAGAGENAKVSCADARELLRILTLFGNMDQDSCAHASSYHLYVHMSEHIALAKREARKLKRQMRGKC